MIDQITGCVQYFCVVCLFVFCFVKCVYVCSCGPISKTNKENLDLDRRHAGFYRVQMTEISHGD